MRSVSSRAPFQRQLFFHRRPVPVISRLRHSGNTIVIFTNLRETEEESRRCKHTRAEVLYKMKRQKRSQSDRAFCKGYLAATENKPLESCPYANGDRHQQWVNGWRDGREDYWNGFGASTKAQKLEQFRTLQPEDHHPDGWSTV